jgi:3-hydroxybutyryl-CoA dehydrogenase
MGPAQLFQRGGDDCGIATFCERYADSFHRWWDDLGRPRLDAATVEALVEGMAESEGARPPTTWRRDATPP